MLKTQTNQLVMETPTDLTDFKGLAAGLKRLMREDPAKAVIAARTWIPSSSQPPALNALKAAVLVDAGSDSNDGQAISEGLNIFEGLLQGDLSSADLHYNVGNGLVALADTQPFKSVDWYLESADLRRRARYHFQQAVELDRHGQTASVALTNIGNAFWKAHRWAEAYDSYARAIACDPTNAVAITGAAKVLLRCVTHRIGDARVLQNSVGRLLEDARKHSHRVEELAGKRAFDELSKFASDNGAQVAPKNEARLNEYQRFVVKHRLALAPTMEGLNVSMKRWDNLQIHSLTEPIGTPNGVPALFAMFNVMKADFLTARYIAFQAIRKKGVLDSGSYSDTLDYAIYGVMPSMLLLAQRACIDLLDKVAVATTEYFAIPGKSTRVDFLSRWFSRSAAGQAITWDPVLAKSISKGNTAIIALAEVAMDVREGGALSRKRSFRHSSTHRFTVLHDLGCDASRISPHVEHCGLDEFHTHLIESLQLARAALLYFVEMISIEERRHRRSGDYVTLPVHDHHAIRGEGN